MAQNTQIINKAVSHIGESGKPTWNAYKNAYGQAWCCQFVWRIFSECGLSSLFYGGKKTAYAPSARQWCKANLAQVPMYLAMAGDIIFFDWENNGVPNHIGFVQSPVDFNSVNTVEGNTGSPSQVRKRLRSSGVQDIWRPLYKPQNLPVEKHITVDGVFGYVSIYFLQKALNIKADCILGKDTVKALQKKAGVSADGQWGSGTSKAVQKMVGATADGAFGKESVKALQTWINKQNGASENPSATASKTETVEKKGYSGKFPTLSARHRFGHCANKKLDCVEIDFTYNSSKSSPKHWAYVAEWKNEHYGHRASDFVKQAIARRPKIQYDNHPNLKKKLIANKGKMPSGSLTANCSNLMAAAVYYASGKVIADKGAKGQLAQLKATGLFNIHTDGRQKKPTSDGAIYGCNRHTGMGIEYTSYLKKGDSGDNVKLLQKFLNWYGSYNLDTDGEFGTMTESAVETFQTAEGLTADGQFGQASLAKAKAVKK